MFTQIITIDTDDFEWLATIWANYDKNTKGSTLVAYEAYANTDVENRYHIVAGFLSEELAKKNDELPATQKLAKEMDKLVKGNITYVNLERIPAARERDSRKSS